MKVLRLIFAAHGDNSLVDEARGTQVVPTTLGPPETDQDDGDDREQNQDDGDDGEHET